MATGDSDDILDRIKKALPRRWFAWVAPYRDALIGGIADGAAWSYSWLTFIRTQSRIASSTGLFLDLIGWDFFAGRFVRRNGESDSSWRPRIVKEILRPRQTREAIALALEDLTTQKPLVLEFFNPQDMGGYDVPIGGYDVGTFFYGDTVPNRFFVTAYRAPTQGVPNVGGYDTAYMGLDVGIQEYIDPSFITGPITDAEIYATIAATIAAGITAWTAIADAPTSEPTVTFTPPPTETPTFEILGF